jgi:hypothetical protein
MGPALWDEGSSARWQGSAAGLTEVRRTPFTVTVAEAQALN